MYCIHCAHNYCCHREVVANSCISVLAAISVTPTVNISLTPNFPLLVYKQYFFANGNQHTAFFLSFFFAGRLWKQRLIC